ncbi:hypothetical protein [Helicobacter rodentium]|nr:hypothetical protein [Helicobacter rodentium]
MESLKQSKVIDCHDSAKAESRNDREVCKKCNIINCFVSHRVHSSQ